MTDSTSGKLFPKSPKRYKPKSKVPCYDCDYFQVTHNRGHCLAQQLTLDNPSLTTITTATPSQGTVFRDIASCEYGPEHKIAAYRRKLEKLYTTINCDPMNYRFYVNERYLPVKPARKRPCDSEDGPIWYEVL